MCREQERHRRRCLIALHFLAIPIKDLADFEKRLLGLPPTLRPTLVLDMEELSCEHFDLELLKYYGLCFENLNIKILSSWLKRKGYG